VHAIRDRTGADLVHLIVSDYGGLCGVAYIGEPFAYHVCGGHTFAHELGHNMGMFHDRFQVQTNEGGAYSSPAYGYVNRRMFEAGSPASSRWTTIMAYDRHGRLVDIGCSALLRFSNRRQRHLGDPLGVEHRAGVSARDGLDGPADVAAVLDATGAVVAGWRDRPPDGVNRPPGDGGDANGPAAGVGRERTRSGGVADVRRPGRRPAGPCGGVLDRFRTCSFARFPSEDCQPNCQPFLTK